MDNPTTPLPGEGNTNAEGTSGMQATPVQGATPAVPRTDFSTSPESGARVDGVTGPSGDAPTDPALDPQLLEALEKKRKLLKRAMVLAAVLLTIYVVFGFVLMALIPAPDGGKQGLKALGMLFYGASASLVTLGGGFVIFRIFKASGGQILPAHVRLFAGIGGIIILVDAFAALTITMISKPVMLSLEIITPSETKNLVAPVAVTFGTERLRAVLAKGGLFPVSYQWDFEGDGKIDTERKETEVTTVYTKKGIYSPTIHVVLSNGTRQQASLRLPIPHAVFSYRPEIATTGEKILFSIADIFPELDLMEVKWDFNGDGVVDVTTDKAESGWTYESTANYRVRATVLLKNGTQETLERTVEVTNVPPGAFDVVIKTEGGTEGTVPHGVIFEAEVEEGIDVAEYTWIFPDKGKMLGKRVSNTFDRPGTYEILLTIIAKDGKAARRSVLVTAWPELELLDLSLKASPEIRQDDKTISGSSPLEVKLEPGTKQPFITFSWQQEGATQIIKQDAIYHAFYDREGTYPLVLTAKDEKGRTLKRHYDVEVLPTPSRIILQVSPPTGSAPLDVHFDASESVIPGKRITGFSWIFGDEEGRGRPEPQYLGSEVDHRYEKPGQYIVIVTAHTEDGVKHEAKKTVIVRESVLDACIFPSRTGGKAPLGVKFYPHCSTGGIASYLWDFGDGTQSEDIEPSHVFEGRGTFNVKLTISDGKGQESETTIQITVE